ncbi:Aste57867_8326 [Aphanomyces stellatus]|uniref:Aste57867_8326 protein n=1 Tax=Aphanomyces stellatus TaxID=120398 RepID=A0A485KJY4_9STRA|nr:hypothetical protein As57867_008294 [Aphanomyces stellatus]VFT85213.1 Aste57867_8326 [Aphanomyces stellatus]
MEKKHRLTLESMNENEPSPKRAAHFDDVASPMALIPITVNPDVTHDFECLSPPSQSAIFDDDHDPELSQLRRYYEGGGKSSIRLKLHASTKACMTPYDRASLEKGDLVDFELGPHDPSVDFGREIFTSQLQQSAATYLGLERLSSRHCRLDWSCENNDVCLFVTDLGSTNGTVVNSTRLVPEVRTRVYHGDIIRLAFMKGNPLRSCKIQYEVEDPRVVRIDTPFRSPAVTLGHNVLVRFRRLICIVHGTAWPRVSFLPARCATLMDPIYDRMTFMLNFQKEYEGLKDSLTTAAKSTWHDHVNYAGVQVVHAAPPIDVAVYFATLDALHMIVSSKCRVLHFSGHGAPDCLYFESDERLGLSNPIPYKMLVQILQAPTVRLHLRLAVVNSCNSEHVAKAFVDCGVPHVIAIRGDTAVEDAEAVHFTQAFYLNLALGRKTVNECFKDALVTISCSPHRSMSSSSSDGEGTPKFTLLPEGIRHDEVVFPHITIPQVAHQPFQARFPNIWDSKVPMLCPHFRFRSIEQLRLCQYLTIENDATYKRWIWITGPSGIGKTQLAHACARFLHPRMAFLGGVYSLNVAELCEDDEKARPKLLHHPHERIYDKIESLLDEFRGSGNRRMERMHKLTRHIHGTPMLVVLDGCDALLYENIHMFTSFVNCKLAENIGLKVITTSEYPCQTDRAHDHGLYIFKTGPMTRRASAKLIVEILFPRKLSVHKMRRSLGRAPGH